MPDKAPLSSDAFQEIFQSMSEGLIMVDETGKVVVANPVAEQIFGYEKEGLVGIMMEDLLPEKYRVGHANLRRGFNSKPSPRRMGAGRDLTALRKDHTEFPVEISLSFTRYKGDLLVMAFVSDISLRKKAEEDLKRSEEQLIVYATELEKKVQMRTEALNNSIVELEKEVVIRKRAEEDTRNALEKERELNELKSRFVSLASHEFRTPLSAVMSSASLISQYNGRGELEKVNKHIQRIKSSVVHLTNILNDFLSLGKLEEGKVDVAKESIDLEYFLSEIEEELKTTLKEGQHINIHLGKGLKSVKSDTRILRNILFNLISNASKYSAEHKSIYLTVEPAGDSIIFGIRDEGIGIPEADFKHMFERFYRATNAGTIQGTGLGLNIVKRYVELLGGTVDFASKLGSGSTFTITFPN